MRRETFTTYARKTPVFDATAPARITLDRQLLTQPFANLIDNARRHCQPGTLATCTITLREHAVDASIHDTGSGIANALISDAPCNTQCPLGIGCCDG